MATLRRGICALVLLMSAVAWADPIIGERAPPLPGVDAKAGVVLVDFFATWCGPCKAISPQIEKLSLAHENVKFYQVDVDKASEVAAENGISAMPTFLFFKDGKKIDSATVRGANPPAIQAGLQQLLA
jgi:thioredoxin 1